MGLSVRKAQRTHSKDTFHGGAPVTVLFTVNPHCVSGGGVPYSEQWDATRAVSVAFSERGRRVTVTLSRQVVGTIEKQNPSTSFFCVMLLGSSGEAGFELRLAAQEFYRRWNSNVSLRQSEYQTSWIMWRQIVQNLRDSEKQNEFTVKTALLKAVSINPFIMVSTVFSEKCVFFRVPTAREFHWKFLQKRMEIATIPYPQPQGRIQMPMSCLWSVRGPSPQIDS